MAPNAQATIPTRELIEKAILLSTWPPSRGNTGNILNKLSSALNTAKPASTSISVSQYPTKQTIDNIKPKNGPIIEMTISCQRVLILSSLRAKPPTKGIR